MWVCLCEPLTATQLGHAIWAVDALLLLLSDSSQLCGWLSEMLLAAIMYMRARWDMPCSDSPAGPMSQLVCVGAAVLKDTYASGGSRLWCCLHIIYHTTCLLAGILLLVIPVACAVLEGSASVCVVVFVASIHCSCWQLRASGLTAKQQCHGS